MEQLNINDIAPLGNFVLPHTDLFANSAVTSRIPEYACTKGDFWVGHSEDMNAPLQLTKVHSNFAISKNLVSQELWYSVMQTNPSNWVGLNLPVERVSWLEAILFCNRLSIIENLEPCYTIETSKICFDGTKNGYRLPFEVEWEYAAKAGCATDPKQLPLYSGSDSYEEVAHIPIKNAPLRTYPIGSKKPNAWGIYDMTGNLNEWCNDLFEPIPPRTLSRNYFRPYDFDVTEHSFEIPLDILQDLQKGFCVVKGGSWFNSPKYSMVHTRHRQSILYPSSMVGIRLVRNI